MKDLRDVRIAQFKLTGLLPDGVEHGTAPTYDNYGCRCDECHDAKRNRRQIQKIMEEERRLGRFV
jgi:hypothetical protein